MYSAPCGLTLVKTGTHCRRQRLRLTDEGRRLLVEATAVAAVLDAEITADLPAADCAALHRILDRLL